MERLIDMLLNLFAEALGILATVFLVDKLLKRREQTRWQYVKQITLVRLFDITTKIILSVIPRSWIDFSKTNIDSYKFGTQYRPILMDEKQLLQLCDVLGKSTEAQIVEINEHKNEILNVLRGCETTLSNVIGQAGFLVEPDIMELTLTLQNSIQDILHADITDVYSNASEFTPKLISINLFRVFVASVFLRLTIVKRKDKIVTPEEFSQDLKSTFKELYPEEKPK